MFVIFFCYDYDKTHRVEPSSSRNPRVLHRVDEVNSRIELSTFRSLFIIHHTLKRPHEKYSIQTPIQDCHILCEGDRRDSRVV